MREKIFELKNISISFSKKKVLDSIDFTIQKGEIVGLLGLNGQGKTTMVKVLLGLIQPDTGVVTRNINIKEDAGIMLQEIAMPEKIKVREWINLIKVFSKKKNNVDDILKQVNLFDERNKFCNELSGGKQRRLQYAAAITNSPTLLVLDEPTVGMDIISKEQFWNNLKDMVLNKDVTILLISHDFQEVQQFSSRIAILNNGRIVFNESKDKLLESISERTVYKLNKRNLELDTTDLFKDLILVEDENYVYISYKNIDALTNLLVTNDISVQNLEKEEKNLNHIFKEMVGLE